MICECKDEVLWYVSVRTECYDLWVWGRSIMICECKDKVLWSVSVRTKCYDMWVWGRSVVICECEDEVLWYVSVRTKCCDLWVWGQSVMIIHVNRPAFGGQSRIFIRCPAKCDRCHAFLENGIIIFFVADYATFLSRNATKWRTSNEDRLKIRTPTDHWTIIDQCDRRHPYLTRGSRRKRHV